MFTAEEATKERVSAYIDALEHEAEGYEFRLKALADGKRETLSEDALKARVSAVKDELARAKKLRSKAAKAEEE